MHKKIRLFSVSSVAQSCPTLCDPMDCSTPGFPVHHQLRELTQTHVHWVSDAIQPSHPLSSPSSPAFSLYQHQGLFRWISSHHMAKGLEFQLQHQSFQWIFNWFPLGLTGWISLLSKGLWRVFSSTTNRSINFLVLSLLYGPTLTSVHDYWKTYNRLYGPLLAKWYLCFLIHGLGLS